MMPKAKTPREAGPCNRAGDCYAGRAMSDGPKTTEGFRRANAILRRRPWIYGVLCRPRPFAGKKKAALSGESHSTLPDERKHMQVIQNKQSGYCSLDTIRKRSATRLFGGIARLREARGSTDRATGRREARPSSLRPQDDNAAERGERRRQRLHRQECLCHQRRRTKAKRGPSSLRSLGMTAKSERTRQVTDLESTSARRSVMNWSSGRGPRSPLVRWRTETVPASASLPPMISM